MLLKIFITWLNIEISTQSGGVSLSLCQAARRQDEAELCFYLSSLDVSMSIWELSLLERERGEERHSAFWFCSAVIFLMNLSPQKDIKKLYLAEIFLKSWLPKYQFPWFQRSKSLRSSGYLISSYQSVNVCVPQKSSPLLESCSSVFRCSNSTLEPGRESERIRFISAISKVSFSFQVVFTSSVQFSLFGSSSGRSGKVIAHEVWGSRFQFFRLADKCQPWVPARWEEDYRSQVKWSELEWIWNKKTRPDQTRRDEMR